MNNEMQKISQELQASISEKKRENNLLLKTTCQKLIPNKKIELYNQKIATYFAAKNYCPKESLACKNMFQEIQTISKNIANFVQEITRYEKAMLDHAHLEPPHSIPLKEKKAASFAQCSLCNDFAAFASSFKITIHILEQKRTELICQYLDSCSL
ncbi:hypothetical protein HOC37_03800 [bacterium]|jgi:hypothetical protein|nr:hypothetical protein [bacterium]MBT3581360.1 hypothetical protein [bacterium]MBT4552093.1 hypothetical protein [bacterium]MBT5988567.1 hypothetical protein [bacterium]MBT7088376.1 hypothetical protein [bacterium]